MSGLVESTNNATDTIQYYQERIASDNKYVKEYPHKFMKTMEVNDFVDTYSYIKDGERGSDFHVQSLMGRIIYKRASGKNLFFYTMNSNGVNIQIMSDKRAYKLSEEFRFGP